MTDTFTGLLTHKTFRDLQIGLLLSAFYHVDVVPQIHCPKLPERGFNPVLYLGTKRDVKDLVVHQIVCVEIEECK